MANESIRKIAKEKNVKLWQVAEACGYVDSTFSRKLRRELPEKKQHEIIGIINQLASERKAN